MNAISKKDWGLNEGQCKVEFQPPYPQVFDTIIIGAGPAGMTAAIYGARRKMKVLLVCGKVGGQMMWSSDIENYTGVGQATGPELTQQFFNHVRKIDDDNAHFDVWVQEDIKVTKVSGSFEENFEVTTDKGEVFESKTVICTSGKIPRTLNVPGESIAMKGNGLSFCATCDAPLYKDKKMVVIGGGNSAMDVALQLDKFTEDITVLTYEDKLMGEVCMMEKIHNSGHIEVKNNITTKEILLDKDNQVRAVLVSQKDGEDFEIECEGVFEEIGQIPATDFLKGFIELNEIKEIPTDRKCNTSIAGFFAGGDCTSQIHKQVIVAAGEGAVAALEAHEYILKH